MPKNDDENQIYTDILKDQSKTWKHQRAWLDITEKVKTSELSNSEQPNLERSWIFRDGTPVTWFKWGKGEPSNPKTEHRVEIRVKDSPENLPAVWNDLNERRTDRLTICTYLLPADSEKHCSWLKDFEI